MCLLRVTFSFTPFRTASHVLLSCSSLCFFGFGFYLTLWKISIIFCLLIKWWVKLHLLFQFKGLFADCSLRWTQNIIFSWPDNTWWFAFLSECSCFFCLVGVFLIFFLFCMKKLSISVLRFSISVTFLQVLHLFVFFFLRGALPFACLT